ncbi:MAG: hypothetical protein C3F10_04565 [Dehalococcoidia bacterium]|nr:MAG: hypothetical protein C3F10_04565 [Dehalococcoidia bacterium]
MTFTDCSNRNSAGAGHGVTGAVADGLGVGSWALAAGESSTLIARQQASVTGIALVMGRLLRRAAMA